MQMQMVLCLNFFDDAHYYYLDLVLGATAVGYDVYILRES